MVIDEIIKYDNKEKAFWWKIINKKVELGISPRGVGRKAPQKEKEKPKEEEW